MPIRVVAVSGQYKCIAITNLPKLPVTRASGRVSSGNLLRVVQLAGVADTGKPTRREIGSVQAGTMVEVLEDWIVAEAPDIVWVSRPIEEMKLREGDTILALCPARRRLGRPLGQRLLVQTSQCRLHC